MNPNRYDQRGVSADKKDVHEAIKHLSKGLFPNAFCKILPDIVAGDKAYCNIMHADTAGTKPSIAYMYFRETGDISVFGGIAQDAIVMNLDDMACAGAVDSIVLSSTIARNKNLINGDVIKEVIKGTSDFIEKMKEQGINLTLAGGETADVGDIVRTIDVGFTAFARLPRKQVQSIDIKANDVIVGLASFGKAIYEDEYNSGIGSNGLTSARHDTLSHYYAEKYFEVFDPAIPYELVFTGSRRLTDHVANVYRNIGQLLLSPTRTFSPVLKKVFKEVGQHISGIIHNTGGAHSKVLKFISGKKVVKNNLFPAPEIFRIIRQESGTDWKEMYKVFNMGTRMEIYLPEAYAKEVIDIAKSFDVDAQIIGHVEEAARREVVLETEYGDFEYR
jgi:phosphoribosylformylglycinamidine cyclo-ligase